MQRLLLPFFFTFFLETKSNHERLNPNKATYEELLTIPILTEEEILKIVLLRENSPFTSLEDLRLRAGIDSTKVEYLQDVLIFEEKRRTYFSVMLEKNDVNRIFKLQFNHWKGTMTQQRESLTSWFLENDFLTLGKFGLYTSTIYPKISVKTSNHEYNILVKRPVKLALGKERIALETSVSKNPLTLTSCLFLTRKERAKLKGGLRFISDPIFFSSSISYPDSVFHTFLILKYKYGRLRYDLRISKSSLWGAYSIYYRLSGFPLSFTLQGNSYGNILGIWTKIGESTSLLTKFSFKREEIKLSEVQIDGKELTVAYSSGTREKILAMLRLLHLQLSLTLPLDKNSPDFSIFTNFKIRHTNLKIGGEFGEKKFKVLLRFYVEN